MIALVALAALGADHELSFELGGLAARDPAWETFSNQDAAPSLGLRLGGRVHDRVSLVAGWHHIRQGADLHAEEEVVGRAAWFGNQLTLGAKADWPLNDYFIPYVTASAVGLLSDARVDDDPRDDDNPGQVREVALTPGALALLGFEVQIPSSAGPSFGVYLEGGWTFLAPVSYPTLGSLDLGGFTLRTGIGVRL